MGDPFAQPLPVTPTPAPSAGAGIIPALPPPTLTPSAGSESPLDTLGRLLFGQGNGSALGGIPVVGDIGRALGPVASAGVGLAIKPIEWGATILSHIPTGWVPGGADEQFRNLGDWQKVNDPTAYAQWKITDAAANADVLGGGNMKADFTREQGVRYADMTKEGVTGPLATTPKLAFSPAGSLGGALVDALGLWDLVPALFHLPTGPDVARGIQGMDIFGGGANGETQMTRIQQIVDRATTGQELNPLEQQVADHMKDGSWSTEHAQNFMIANGQGFFRDFIPQMLSSIAADPLTYMMAGGAVGTKLIKAGTQIAAAGQGAQSALESLELATSAMAANKYMAPVLKITGALINNPFGVLPKTTATQGLVDLIAGAATKSLDGIYGAGSISSAFKTGSELGITARLQSALGTYTANLARQFVVTAHRATEALTPGGAERLVAEVTPDSLVDVLMKTAPNDVVTRLTDYGYGLRQLFVGNPADDAQLAARATAAFGDTLEGWTARVAKMGDEEKSLWHAGTYSESSIQFNEALGKVGGYTGSLPVAKFVLMNDNKLDNIAAQLLREDMATAKALKEGNVAAQVKVWNDAAAKFSKIGDIGRAQEGQIQLDQLVERLTKLIDSGRLHTRVMPDELGDPALKSLQAFLDANTIDGKRLWNIGFAPDDLYLWGFERDPATDLLRIDSEPFVSHVYDAVPASRPVNDIARNLMGQVIGPVAAGKLARPIEAMEVSIKTAQDIVTGQRLIMNMEQRFTSSMAKLGVAGRESRKLFRAARDAAQLQHTTIQGVSPTNVWKAVEDIIPVELQGVVTQRTMMNELLAASGGDLRIMGLTSGFTQRARTMLTRAGLPENYAGQATVNFYRTVRYTLNPCFYIQRITDGIYFNILKGVPAVWTSRALKEGSPLWQAEQVLAKMGETGLARDFGMDMREYQLRSDIQDLVRSKLGTIVPVGRLEGIVTGGGRWQINNQVAHFSSRLGDIVTESINEARATFEKMATDPALSAAEQQGYRDALDRMVEWNDIATQYSTAAGRTLTSTEVGLKYIQEMFHDSLGQKLSPEGDLVFRNDIKTGVYHKPANIGQVGSLNLDYLAADLGYVDSKGAADVAALREAISPTSKSGRSADWLRERLQQDFSAHPDYVKRAVYALQFDSGEFWGSARMALDLSPQETEQLRGVISREALSRGMQPNEYLSQVLRTNLGPINVNDHLGKLLEVIKGGFVGSERQQINKLTSIFMGTMDLSAQRTVLANYQKTLPDLAKQAYDAGDLVRWQQLNHVQRLLESTVTTGAAPTTLEEARAMYPDAGVAQDVFGTTAKPVAYELNQSFGPGVDLLTKPEQANVVQVVHELRSQFPDIDLVGVDLRNLGSGGFGLGKATRGVTLADEGVPGGGIAIVLDTQHFGPGAEARLAARQTQAEMGRSTGAFTSSGGVTLPRGSFQGTSWHVGVTLRDDIWHEFGHVVEDNLLTKFAGSPAADEFNNFVTQYANSEGRKWVSEYSLRGQNVAAEAWAELFNLSVNPDYANVLGELQGALAADTLPIGSRDAAVQLVNDIQGAQRLLVDNGLLVPGGQMTAPAVSEGFADLVARRAAGEAIANTDVEAIVQGFVKWTKDTVASELTKGSRGWVGKLANELVSKVPIDNAYVYNRSEGLVEQLLRQKIVLAQRDAFRLAEMSTQRTVAGRTLNHPVWGLYPSSYMWGKVFPEMVKFLAQSPFGFETSAGAYELAKVEQAIAIQREYDPGFGAAVDKIGGGPTAFLLDYLTPSLPWSDMRAASPPWMQAIADNKTGEVGKAIGNMTEYEARTIDPRRWVKQFGAAGTEIQGWAQGALTPAAAPTGTGSLDSLVSHVAPAAAAPATGAAAALAKPLTNAMDELTSLFNQ